MQKAAVRSLDVVRGQAVSPLTCSVVMTVLAAILVPVTGWSQHASEFTTRDKTEVFIQHVVKFMNLEPKQYQALVLEYEIGQALAETKNPIAVGDMGNNFIESALIEFHPEYKKARALFDAKDDEKAGRALSPLLAKLDPYVAAHARLLVAEIEFRAGEYDKVIKTCEHINQKDRLRLIEDYRACELIALSFEKKEKHLLAFSQYFLLLIDYADLPKTVEKRTQARVNELNAIVGKPLQKVANWMNSVEKLLAEEMTDKPTQSKESDIVVALDKLIELQEAKERQSCKNCGSCSNGACKNNCDKLGNKPNKHAKESRIPPAGDGDMKLAGVSRANAGSIWGQLRMKDASRALQSFGSKLPTRYEKLLEQYYKALSRDQ